MVRFLHQVRRDRYNDPHRDCIQCESDFVFISIGDDLIEQDMAEVIVSSVKVWKTESQTSVNSVVIEVN